MVVILVFKPASHPLITGGTDLAENFDSLFCLFMFPAVWPLCCLSICAGISLPAVLLLFVFSQQMKQWKCLGDAENETFFLSCIVSVVSALPRNLTISLSRDSCLCERHSSHLCSLGHPPPPTLPVLAIKASNRRLGLGDQREVKK